jgi:ATP-dependent DNA helicase RecG
MIIQNAERFGLAQLHQLRGRVGRGVHQSYCILKYEGNSRIIKERMDVITKTNDGFVISEKDLELRGSGEFFGTKQHGIPEFKIANLFEDINILKGVQSLAMEIIDKDPYLEKEENEKLRKMVQSKFKERIEI